MVVGGDNDEPLSSVELFPRPSSDACAIPDLPQPRQGHSVSLLSGGRLVVCGGVDRDGNRLRSCIYWAAGNNSWTHLFDTRFLPSECNSSQNYFRYQFFSVSIQVLLPVPYFTSSGTFFTTKFYWYRFRYHLKNGKVPEPGLPFVFSAKYTL